MAESLDVDAMIQRFRDRAEAVKSRPLPPVAGDERTRFVEQAQIDFQDFAIIGDAEATLEDGVLVLRDRPAARRRRVTDGAGRPTVRRGPSRPSTPPTPTTRSRSWSTGRSGPRSRPTPS